MEFKLPLRSGDEFVCSLTVKKENVRYVFLQQIHRVSDGKLCLKAKVDSVCVQDGQLLSSCKELEDKLFG